MEEKKAKGAVVNGYLSFIKRKWGTQGVEKAMKYAGINTRPKDGEWFSMVKTDNVLEWIAKNKGMEYVKESGKYTAMHLGIFEYLLASIMGMEHFLKRAGETYRTLYNFGEVRVKIEGKNATVELKGANLTGYSCPAWKGFLLGIMEVTGITDTQKSHGAAKPFKPIIDLAKKMKVTKINGTVKPVEPESPEDCRFILEWD